MTQLEYKFNDGGRAEAGFKGTTGDCATRAIAIATGMSYQDTYDLVNRYCALEKPSKTRKGKSNARTGVHTVTFKKIVSDLGFTWHPLNFIGSHAKAHMIGEELPLAGTYILNVSKHYTTLVDGVVQDTFNPSRQGTRMVYGYWYKEHNHA
jgi:hypothetical protein